MTHRAENGVPAADRVFPVAGQNDYHQSLPVFDKDADDGPPPTPEPDGSAWEPAASSETWEDQLVADPEAAAEATRERMAEQFEEEKAAAGIPDNPPPADAG